MKSDPSLPETQLVQRLVRQRVRGLDGATRERLAQALLDWFTAGWSGAVMPGAAPLRAVAAQTLGGAGAAPVFGGGTMPSVAAAFANAGIAHLREIDDAHRSALLHPGVVAVTPVLALASHLPLTRAQVAAGIVAGYEVAVRLGEALGAAHGARFHPTATAGSVAAAAAAGVALGLSAETLHHALGIAATQAAGLWQLMDDGAEAAKSLHPALAVRNGLTAAFAAQAGLPGARAFVSGPRGLYALMAGDGPMQRLGGDPDGPDRIHTATIKAWPCCAQLFTPLDALQDLMARHALRADDVAALDIAIFPHALKIAGVDWPQRASEAPFCLRYVAAALLLHGRLGIAELEQPDLADGRLLALAARVQVVAEPALQVGFPDKRPSVVTLRLHDGRTLSARREQRRGDPEDPFDGPALQARMRAFVPHMNDACAAAITAWSQAFVNPDGDAQVLDVDAALFAAIR